MRFEFGINVELSFKDKHYVGHKMFTDSSWSRIRRMIRRRDGAICRYCGAKDANGHVDHIIPLSRGGSDDLGNLVWSCSTCNLRKGSLTADEFYVGISGRSGIDMDAMPLPAELDRLPVPLGKFMELVEGVLRGDLAWSRASMMSLGITDALSRNLKGYLKDKGWIEIRGKATGGYSTTEKGYADLKGVVASLNQDRETEDNTERGG